MDTRMLTSRDFRRLAETAEGLCVSLLMSAHPSWPEAGQDPIRFKNLIAQAEETMTRGGMRSPDVRKQLQPLRDLLDDALFWSHQNAGLAAYCLPGETVVYGVPFPLPERVVVGPHPYLVPLLPLIGQDVRFYVLSLSPKQVRLLEATPHSERELELPGWPDDFEQLAAYIEEQSQLQFHTEAQPDVGASHRAAMFHGHPAGDEGEVRKQRMREYCRLIDERVRQALPDGDAPLVLACDERLAVIYREATQHPSVVERPVAGNPDLRKPAELRSEAWQLLKGQLDEARATALRRYHQAGARGKAAGGLASVIPAAHQGRVDTLLVTDQSQQWGRYDPEQQRLDLHDRPDNGDEDLVNLATIVAYLQGADVHCLPQDQMPEKQEAAAVLRY